MKSYIYIYTPIYTQTEYMHRCLYIHERRDYRFVTIYQYMYTTLNNNYLIIIMN